ncbi:MAG: hypothetical protein KDA46_10380 [Parvularculaceae bacterium]|nr:hypothetical protein [Parvularculaceae bacterium]
MKRKFVEYVGIPVLAVAIAAGAALASGSGYEPQSAYGPAVNVLEAEAAARHASAVFDRADLNADGELDAREYEALSIVTAELARLNGFVSVDFDGVAAPVALPITAPKAMTSAERIRVEAIASREFHLVADGDDAITHDEYVSAQLELFAAADQNRNGVLSARELQSYAAWQAHLTPRNA